MVDFVNNPLELENRLMRYSFTGASAELASKLQKTPGSPADRLANGAEVLYAYFDELNQDGLKVTGELFNYALQMGWSGFNKGDRTSRIVSAITNIDNGESVADQEWPEPEIFRRAGTDWRAVEEEPLEP